MAVTTFSLSVSEATGRITYVRLRDPQSGDVTVTPFSGEVWLTNRQTRLTIVDMLTTLPGMSGLEHLYVEIDTYDSHGVFIKHSAFIASNDPYIDVSTVPGAVRYVTFSIYRPVVTTTHYQIYCGDDVSRARFYVGSDLYTVTAENSPLVFDYDGDITLFSVYGPNGESCAANKVDLTSDGSTWLMSASAIIPEKPNGTRSVFIRYFGIDYTAQFRTMQDGFSYQVYVNGTRKASVGLASVPVSVTIHSNEEVTLSGFTHPEGFGRPWNVFADSNGSWQDSSAEQIGGSYKLWFQSRNRRVQAKPSSKREMRFNWWSEVYDPVKIKAKKFFSVNMTAACWNRFCQKLYDTYRLWNRYPSGSLPTVSSGDELTADVFNRAGELISGLPGAGSCPVATSGQVVKASYFHEIKAVLNAAIEHYMDSDD